MPEKNEYLVYGDDYRVEQEKLDELAEKADQLMEIRSRAVGKMREKNRVIPQPSLDDPKYADNSAEELGDIEDETPSEVPVPEPEKSDTEDKKTKKSKKKPKPLLFIILGVVLAAIVLTALSLLKKPKDSATENVINNNTNVTETETPDSTVEEDPKNTEAPEPTPAASASPAATEGYLKLIDESKEYALSDTLAFAKSINDVTQNYLNKAVDEVVAYQRDQTKIIKEDLATLRTMLDYDIETLKTYETMFDTYGGVDYIRNAEARLDNVAAMYDAIGEDFASTADLVNKANEYITTENTYAQKAKDSLISYLDSNKVVYHLEDDQINYDSMQFINNINGDNSENPTEVPEAQTSEPEESTAPEDSGN